MHEAAPPAASTIGTLRPIRPIGPIETTGTIDSHPLVREYFGAKPEPLFAAVAHGCLASRDS